MPPQRQPFAQPRNAYEQTLVPPGYKPPVNRARSQSPLRANPDEEFDMSQLERLDKMMVVVSLLGLVINVVQITAISNHAWLSATAISDGQPFNAYLSLGSATFGNATHPTKDNKYFCGPRSEAECSLRSLCAATPSTNLFPNGLPRQTPQPSTANGRWA